MRATGLRRALLDGVRMFPAPFSLAAIAAVFLATSGPADTPREPETFPAAAKESSNEARIAPAIDLADPADRQPLKWTWM